MSLQILKFQCNCLLHKIFLPGIRYLVLLKSFHHLPRGEKCYSIPQATDKKIPITDRHEATFSLRSLCAWGLVRRGVRQECRRVLYKLAQVISRLFKYPYNMLQFSLSEWDVTERPREVSDPISAVAQSREQGKLPHSSATATRLPVPPARDTPGQPITGICTMLMVVLRWTLET